MLTRSKKRDIEEDAIRQLVVLKHAKRIRDNACNDLLKIMNYEIVNVPAITNEHGNIIAIYSKLADVNYSDWLYFNTKYLSDIHADTCGQSTD